MLHCFLRQFAASHAFIETKNLFMAKIQLVKEASRSVFEPTRVHLPASLLGSNTFVTIKAVKKTVPPKNDKILKNKKFLLLMKYQHVADVVVEFYSCATYVKEV